MKAKEIIKNVCVYLGKEEILASNLFETGGQVLTDVQNAEVNKMLKCLNLITSEIASDYLPILREKEIKLVNGEVDVFEIDKSIQEIVNIKSKFGKNLKYKFINNKIICLATNVVVTYKIRPSEIKIDDEAESFGGKLSERILAYGVASEFCFLEMLYDDASIWENRFKNALFISARKKGELKLKNRGWF